MTDDQIHWFSIINSLMIVLFLSGMVAMIMMRTLHRDISKYNQLETAEEAQEETGWKLVTLPCLLIDAIAILQIKDKRSALIMCIDGFIAESGLPYVGNIAVSHSCQHVKIRGKMARDSGVY